MRASQFGLKKSPLNFQDLNRILSRSLSHKNPSTHALPHGHVFLLPDRSLSPAGTRRLKDLRCLGFGGTHPWPNPGVYSLPEMALRVVKHYEIQTQNPTLLKERASVALKSFFALKAFPTQSFKQVQAQLMDVSDLGKLGLGASDLVEILRFLEENNHHPELRKESQRLLFWSQLRNQLDEQGLWESEWNAVEQSLEVLNHCEFSPSERIKLLERHPREVDRSQELTILMPLYRDLFALEIQFLKALSKHFRVECIEVPESLDNSPLDIQWIDSLKKDPRIATVHWAFHESKSGMLEALHLLQDLPQLDFEAARTFPLASPEHAKFFQTLAHHANPTHQLMSWAEELTPELSQQASLRKTLEDRYRQSDPAEALHHLLQLGWRGESSKLESHFENSRLSASGVGFLSLEDVAITAQGTALLWTNPTPLRELTDPNSLTTLKKQIFPPALKQSLEAKGYHVPDPQMEAGTLRALLQNRAEGVRAWAGISIENKAQLGPRNLELQRRAHNVEFSPSSISPSSFSPSSIEAYLHCPHRYYLERDQRLRHSELWDALDISALSKGRWIHRALELFLQNPDFLKPEILLYRLLEENLVESFNGPSSPSYQTILRSQIPTLVERLSEHVSNFEFPLFQEHSTRKLCLEENIRSEFENLKLFGKVDRIDVLPDAILLWDYKTGAITGKAQLQIRQGRIQWFLYQKMIESAFKKPVIGGGYLNPLEPEKSKLFLYPSAHADHLAHLFVRNSHPVELIQDPSATEDSLVEQLHHFSEGFHRQDFNPRPLIPSECARCAVKELCGRPFLVEDNPEEVENFPE